MSDVGASAILFDLDGVLVDSSSAIADSINRALLDAGRPAAAESVIRGLIGMPLHDIFERLGCGSGAALDEYVAAYRAEYELVAPSQTTVVAGVPEVLEALSPRHSLAVATTKPLEFARPILERLRPGPILRRDLRTLARRSQRKQAGHVEPRHRGPEAARVAGARR